MTDRVPTRQRAGLVRVLDHLGTTLLELVCGRTDRADDVSGVAIYDPLDRPVVAPQTVVLGVGVRDACEVEALLREVGAQRAAALVVREPVPVDAAVAAAVASTGVALLGLARGATWVQLAAMLRTLLSEPVTGPGETLDGVPLGDLFAVANAVAELLAAPVTIEDRSSRVLAFSGGQLDADASRAETILGRQIPERCATAFEERGVFEQLYRSDTPVYVDPVPALGGGLELGRMAMAVRAGDEVLGSVWAAVSGPLCADRCEALREASNLVALHLLRLRGGADAELRLRADLVGSALQGGVGGADAVVRLGLGGRCVVLALGQRSTGPSAPAAGRPSREAAELQRLTGALAMHLGATAPRSSVALLGDVVYAIVPGTSSTGDDEVVRLARRFLGRTGERTTAVIGVGAVAGDPHALASSRASADRALRVLRSGAGGVRVGTLRELHVASLLLDLGDLAASRGDAPSGPVDRLLAYDAEHGTQLLVSLRAWLEAFGSVSEAAAATWVHPSTFRYRLRRATEVAQVDLADADTRFGLLLQLRLPASQPA